MKKIFVVALGCVAFAGMVACSESKEDNQDNQDNQTKEQIVFGDSIATAIGHVYGASERANYDRNMAMLSPEDASKLDREKFMAGLELVLKTDTTDISYLNGIYAGLNMYNPMIMMSTQSGCNVSPNAILRAFRQVYFADTVDQATQVKYNQDFQNITMRIRQRASEEKLKEGAAYQAKVEKEGYTKTESGLLYKINNPGGERKVSPDDQIAIRYIGKHINGEVFDQTENQPYESNASMFIPGFTEGLQLIGEGGSVTLVIPSELAYGTQGALPKIAPGETLVFEVTVENIL